jgi:hypothetical protein
MRGEAIRLGQILKFFNIRVRVSGEGTEAFINLRQVCERKGNMNSHNTLGARHLSEGVEGNRLAGGVRDSKWVVDPGDPVVLSWWDGGGKGKQREEQRGGGSSRRSGGRRGRGQWLNNGSLCLIGWKLISGVKRRECIGIREGSWGSL